MTTPDPMAMAMPLVGVWVDLAQAHKERVVNTDSVDHPLVWQA